MNVNIDENEAEDFGQIIPFSNAPTVPDFPVAALPAPVADMVSALAVKRQVSPEMPATVALGILAACCQKKNVLRVDEDHYEQLSLFTLSIAASSERKSAVFKSLKEPVKIAEREFYEKHADDIRRSNRLYGILLKRRALLESKNFDEHGNEDTEVTERLHGVDKDIAEFKRFLAPKLFLDDISSEQLIVELAERGGSAAIESTEGGLFTKLKNNAALSAAFDVYLKAYTGDSIDVQRVTRLGNMVDEPRLSLIVACQTDVAKSVVSNPIFRDKGLSGRFLYAVCRSMAGYRDAKAPRIPSEVKDEYAALIRRLLDYANDRDTTDREITLTEDGFETYCGYDADNELKLRADGRFADMTDWGGKLSGQMLRIAGILALCEGLTEADSEIISRACAIADWYAYNAELLFVGDKQQGEDAKHLLSVLLKTGGGITERELKRKVRGKNALDFQGAIDELERRNYIKVEYVKTAGRPSRIIKLNPMATTAKI